MPWLQFERLAGIFATDSPDLSVTVLRKCGVLFSRAVIIAPKKQQFIKSLWFQKCEKVL